MRPRGIQLQRVKGWKMPPDTISVARPSQFGNAFKIGKLTRAQAIENHRAATIKKLKVDPDYLGVLRNQNLACYCPLDMACHRDTLLALANRPRRV